MKITFNEVTLDVSSKGKTVILTLDDKTIQAEVLHSEDGRLGLLIEGKRLTAFVSSDGVKYWVTIHGQTLVLTKSSGARRRGHGAQHAAGELTAPMPGQIRALNVSEGESVKKGQTLLVLEAMKMEIRVQAPREGMVRKLLVRQGQIVEREQILIEIEESS